MPDLTGKVTYRIDEDRQLVWVSDDEGKFPDFGFLTFSLLSERRLRWVTSEERNTAYLIARDELIERGLIEDRP